MDLDSFNLETLTFTSIITTSISIPRSSPRTFSLLTLSLIFPLSFVILAHSLFTHPLYLHLKHSPSSSSPSYHKDLLLLLIYQLSYLLFLFTFSLLSTASIVFTVSCLYSSRSSPLSFSSSLSSIRSIFPRLFLTFIFVIVIFFIYYFLFFLSLLLFPHFLLFPILLLFLFAHIYISALWHLASVVSVLEPLCGLPALFKSRQLLQGKTRLGLALFSAYLGACAVIGLIFRVVVVAGPEEKGSLRVGMGVKVVVGGALVSVLVVVNLVGLLVQSVFYYVCKSFHHQEIDKSALADHLGGYLGEYVPLKSSIQLENL